jgi:hypothetical protein
LSYTQGYLPRWGQIHLQLLTAHNCTFSHLIMSALSVINTS